MTAEHGERIAAALERIAAALEVVVAGTLPPASETEPVGCAHPDEARVNFGLTDGNPDWLCQACGYRSVLQDETHG